MRNLLTDSFAISKPKQTNPVDIEMGVPGGSGQPGFEGYFEKVDEIEKLIDSLSKLLKGLQDANEESKVVTKASVVKEIKKRMEHDMNQVTKVARTAKQKLEELDRENLANRARPGFGPGSGVDRSRTSTSNALKRRLKDKISEFQILREAIQKEYREVVERRVFTVTGQRPNEETIDTLIETGDSEQIFQKAIQEQGRGRILDTVQEIQERHDSVKDIEKKLGELHQIFLDLSTLVDSQGEILDSIENQVSSSADYIQSGTQMLQKARASQKSSRKWMCIGIILLLIIIVIIILSIQPWKQSSSSSPKPST